VTRAIICVLDSLGIGHSEDADRFDDVGADTLGHIAEACANGDADRQGVRSGPLKLPNLYRLGLGVAAHASRGAPLAGYQAPESLEGVHGYAVEQSAGKDTPSGHWELAGLPVLEDWGYFPKQLPAFPQTLTQALIEDADLPGLLGNCHASGTDVLKEFGEAHMKSGKPICYTSADSVFQIAAHEDVIPPEHLYEICEIAFVLVSNFKIARVIARPFTGTEANNFKRTGNRRDFTVPPPGSTLLNAVETSGNTVISVGKIKDIFAGSGVSRTIKAEGNMALFDATLDALDQAGKGDLIFTNFVDFDMLYGHRRDVSGYANALEKLDERIPELEACLKPGDIVVLTADHGCDPTWPGTDHTREHVPIIAFGPGIGGQDIGQRASFADIGATLRHWLGLPTTEYGTSWF